MAVISLLFYSWWNVIYLPLILGSMVFNYFVGLALTNNTARFRISRKVLLAIGISVNVGLLAYFKYTDFLIVNLNFIFHSNQPLLNLALPLAISFFTFQQIAYLMDSFRYETRSYDFLSYTVFVSFFPQLIAGPIVHHKEIMPQFAHIQNKMLDLKNIASGLFIFSVGLFKKVVIADTFAVWAVNGFDNAKILTFCEAWATSLSYTFQLYFDFSGYTDMAIGAALLFNIRLPINFNAPYKSLDIQDFWRRWHITLGRFLRNYIYIPLGGNRHGNIRICINLMATFIIGGIWHGAGWTFVFWGFLHGSALVLHRLWRQWGGRLNKTFAWLITFNFINIAWVFFRAEEWRDALKVLKGMFGFSGVILPSFLADKLSFLKSFDIQFGGFVENISGDISTIVWIAAFFWVVLFFENQFNPLKSYKTAVVGGLLFSYSVLSLNRVSEFLYFNF